MFKSINSKLFGTKILMTMVVTIPILNLGAPAGVRNTCVDHPYP